MASLKKAFKKAIGSFDKGAQYLGDPGALQRTEDNKKKAEEAIKEQQNNELVARQNMMAQNLATNMKIDLGLTNVADVVAGGEAERSAMAFGEDARKRKRGGDTALSSVLGIRL